MNILLIGSGGREHALAWKLSQSPGARISCLPGNPGTAQVGENLPGRPDEIPGVVTEARARNAQLVVIGPEAPLADGLTDALQEAGFLVFGPSQAAAQIEASKTFAKAFMARHALPTARFEAFNRYEDALRFLHAQAAHPHHPVVIKASGLAAGKGVFLPDSLEEGRAILRSLLMGDALGAAGRQVVIEERLNGREVSVLAFTDGHTLAVMPPVQDHKRLLDGNLGPNTGGMGTFAPSPFCPAEVVEQVKRQILQPAVDGLREEGRLFVGVLYAGLMLTSTGPQILEFNARFGDPETQVLMPLLESDLAEILLACAQGRLAEAAPSIRWRTGAAMCVVVAAPGYPEKPLSGSEIEGVEALAGREDTWAFHAGTQIRDGRLRAAGGRVLGITAYADDLDAAVGKAYAAVSCIKYEGMLYRRDIGRSEADDIGRSEADDNRIQPLEQRKTAYEAAGVSISAGNRAVALMREAVRSTYSPQVLSDVGAFGGLYHAAVLQGMHDPVLVASTDGIGTKVDLASAVRRYTGLGYDIVNHCVNDILVQGARPLFFLDYIASGRLDPQMVAELVGGMSAACREAGCALLGGETAEMPGVYAEGRFDVAGAIVGVVEREAILPRPGIQPGDLLLGMASSGPHTNGYSLLRRIFAGSLETVYPELGMKVVDALLAPHRSYLPLLDPVLRGGATSPVKALAHLTGGGFIDNIPRVLPPGCGVMVRRGSWPIPPLFTMAQRLGAVEDAEMFQVFNLGIGMVVFLAPPDLPIAQAAILEKTWVIGEVIEGKGVLIQ